MKFMIIDGNSIINRAFYGIRALNTRDGRFTNAVYGFLNIFFKEVEEEKPDGVCIAFDTKDKTFRHERFEDYKAQRKPMPDELAQQIPLLKQVLRAMNVPGYELAGYEADDIIGTICKSCSVNCKDCVVITGDKDSLQLIDAHTKVKLVRTRMGQTETTLFDEEHFYEVYGFAPDKLTDLKGLMGDSSDNIPGVAGIGEKTAMSLVSAHGGIEDIYSNLEGLDLKPAVVKRLKAGKEMAFTSKELATIDREVPLDFDFDDNLLRKVDSAALYELFLELEFQKLIDKLELKPLEPQGIRTKQADSLKLERIEDPKELELLQNELRQAETVFLISAQNLEFIALLFGEKSAIVMQNDFTDTDYESFLKLIFSPELRKCSYNVKDIMRGALEFDIYPEGFVFDTSLAAYVLNPSEGSYSLERTCLSYLKRELKGGGDFAADALSPLGDFEAAFEAILDHLLAVKGLYELLKPLMSSEGFDPLYYEIELPLCVVLASMERVGLLVDRESLADFSSMLTVSIDRCTAAIYELAGEEFNINSTKRLGQILFDKLGLPPVKKTKTGYSTNIEVLEKLKGRHEIIEQIIEYRMLTKLKSTYADGLLKVIAPDGRIHTSFNMTATATGRLSSTEPNLQNIPVRSDLGGEIRKMFIAGEGQVFVDADYSQIELRVLAHISGDENMIQAFAEGRDIHTVTASQVFGVELSEVTPLMRRHAKAVNFGIVYGISEFSLAEDIGVTRAEAKLYIDNYLGKYSGVREYMSEIVESSRESGYVSTMFGRRRYLPNLRSGNFNLRSGAERMALNTPIQGSAADIIKLAMIRVHKRLRQEGLKARLVLQVHDELIVQAPKAEAGRVAEILTEEMEGVVSLKAPLVAEAAVGDNWFDAK